MKFFSRDGSGNTQPLISIVPEKVGVASKGACIIELHIAGCAGGSPSDLAPGGFAVAGNTETAGCIYLAALNIEFVVGHSCADADEARWLD